MIETALNEEITEHLGYEKHDPAGQGAGSGNVRNGSRPKTVLTDSTGQVAIDVPRDRAGTFEPQIVRKRQRRLTGVDEIVLSLYAKGLTTGEISAHFAEIYGASVSKETVSRITDKVIEEMQAWQNRPLDEIYAAVFIDAIVVKIRVLSLILWCQWVRRTRFRRSSRLARPNIWRLSILSRLMLPSTGPELQGRVRPAVTASWSRRRLVAKAARGGRVSCSTAVIHASRRSPWRPVIMSAKART